MIEPYSVGICYMSVCSDEPIENILEWVNKIYPTGIQSHWQKSDDETFMTGQPNPSPCDMIQGRKHWLLNC